MNKFIKGIKLFLKMKFEMLIWRLYDKCSDYLDKNYIVRKVDPDMYEELEEELRDKCDEIIELKDLINYQDSLLQKRSGL